MLGNPRIAARLPAQDLVRARRFYSEKLGLDPVDERPGGLLYHPSGGGEFALYESVGAASGAFTQMAFEVDDIDATGGFVAVCTPRAADRNPHRPPIQPCLPDRRNNVLRIYL